MPCGVLPGCGPLGADRPLRSLGKQDEERGSPHVPAEHAPGIHEHVGRKTERLAAARRDSDTASGFGRPVGPVPLFLSNSVIVNLVISEAWRTRDPLGDTMPTGMSRSGQSPPGRAAASVAAAWLGTEVPGLSTLAVARHDRTAVASRSSDSRACVLLRER